MEGRVHVANPGNPGLWLGLICNFLASLSTILYLSGPVLPLLQNVELADPLSLSIWEAWDPALQSTSNFPLHQSTTFVDVPTCLAPCYIHLVDH